MDIEMDKGQKFEFVLAILQEKYASLHEMRKRIQSTTAITVAGLFGTCSWSLVNSNCKSGWIRLSFCVFFVAVTLYVLWLIADITKGFKSTQRIAANLENRLGCYERGVYGELQLLPEEYKQAGTHKGSGRFINSSIYIIWVACICSCLAQIFIG